MQSGNERTNNLLKSGPVKAGPAGPAMKNVYMPGKCKGRRGGRNERSCQMCVCRRGR